ncbi:DUF599 domain-containing protein [Flaviflagellibacter deserti]|uniref:DUF599 domain-containing protein n=1 Tax=Flaviflagellibacter deserti TaxID=2267266 RepID=A0ABV9Z166_9HYPH
MFDFTPLDYVALGLFALAWVVYYIYLEFTQRGGLNAIMHEARVTWMRQMYHRENRILDGQIMGGLQNGTAFFASSSLLAIGGTLSALGTTDTALEVLTHLPLASQTTRATFEIKVLGLALIFAYSFFKLVWSYRLFNYVAILIGATPIAGSVTDAEAEIAIQRAARMNMAAARQFNRGLRAFFFAIAYLGWFAGPLVLMVTTLIVTIVLWRRQFASDSVEAASFGGEA